MGMKPECPNETHTDMGITSKPSRDWCRIKPRTFQMRSDRVNHYTCATGLLSYQIRNRAMYVFFCFVLVFHLVKTCLLISYRSSIFALVLQYKEMKKRTECFPPELSLAASHQCSFNVCLLRISCMLENIGVSAKTHMLRTLCCWRPHTPQVVSREVHSGLLGSMARGGAGFILQQEMGLKSCRQHFAYHFKCCG